MLRYRCGIEKTISSSNLVGATNCRLGKIFSVQLAGIIGLRLWRLDATEAIKHFADPLGAVLLQLLVGQSRGVEPDRRVQAQQASLSFGKRLLGSIADLLAFVLGG